MGSEFLKSDYVDLEANGDSLPRRNNVELSSKGLDAHLELPSDKGAPPLPGQPGKPQSSLIRVTFKDISYEVGSAGPAHDR
jgi:hypothetical protein